MHHPVSLSIYGVLTMCQSGPVVGVGTQLRTRRAVSQSLWYPEQALERWVVTGLLDGFKEVQDTKGGYNGGSWCTRVGGTWGIPRRGILASYRVRGSEVKGFGVSRRTSGGQQGIYKDLDVGYDMTFWGLRQTQCLEEPRGGTHVTGARERGAQDSIVEKRPQGREAEVFWSPSWGRSSTKVSGI